MTSIRRPGWPMCWRASPSTRLTGSMISCPGIGVLAKHAFSRQPDLGRHLTRLRHHLRCRTARRGRGLAPRTVDRHVPGRWSPIRLPRQGRRLNRIHRRWHRELETDHRRHASRRPRASPYRFNRVTTVGTLLHIAQQHGADFSQWKDVARYEPDNAEECRKLLDSAVAADARTFTLGNQTGPLVILRTPQKDTLPPKTRWDGDLPGTTLATAADIMQRAERLRWMQRRGGKGGPRLARTHPPRPFIGDYLVQMRGQYGAVPLRGIVRVPRINDSGEIKFIAGYASETGLFHDRSPTFDVLPNPSRDDARKAAEILLYPFSRYKFDDPAAGRAVLLAAIFTAIERPFLPVAPMFVVRSSMPATGKGLIVRGLVQLAFDTTPVVVTWGGNGEEFEKRLGAILLQAPAAIMIDNANGINIQGDLL